MFARLLATGICHLAVLCAGCISLGAAVGIRVSDFGAVADDSACDLEAIRKAVAYARSNNIREIRFEAGTYELHVKNPGREAAIALNGFQDLVFSGATNPDGSPATVLLRKYKFSTNMNARQIIRAAKCKNIRIKNFILDNAPRYTTAGKVVEKNGDRIVMEIFDGNPAIDGTVFYCGNAWDLKTRTLKKIGSLTFGADVAADEKAHKLTLLPQTVPGAARRMALTNAKVAARLDIGDGVSWHFGFMGNQLNVTESEDVHLENIRTLNAIGFCASVSRSKNVFARDFVIKPEGNQLAVGSRDGLMLSCNRGTVVMDNLHIEGVRWDGQNAHAIFLWLKERLDESTALFESKGGMAGKQNVQIQSGSKIGFHVGRDDERQLTVRQADLLKNGSGGFYYKIAFEERIPIEVNSNSPVCVYAWNMDDYTVKNSRFRNIAGCASLVRNSGARLENCIYEYIMYPAVMAGPAISEQEGPVTRDVLVKNCRFMNCGWQSRHGARAAVGVKTQIWKGRVVPLMRNIRVESNYFENCDTGVQIEGVRDSAVCGNTFVNVARKVMSDDIMASLIKE